MTKEELKKEAQEQVNCCTPLYPESFIQGYIAGAEPREKQLTKAKEIILKLYNAGRDVLMCRAEEKAYDNLENAINDRSIEQFLKEIEK